MAKTIAKQLEDNKSSSFDKKKALELALSNIEKRYGQGAIMRLGQRETMNIEAISTGSLSLDVALGIGGLPRGRIVEIFGPESSGKTTVALHVAAEAQKNDGTVAFIDVEHALDPIYAGNLGVDVDSLLVSQPDSGEQALEIAEMLIRSGSMDVVVIDSVAAMTTKAEIEGDMGDSHVGLQARLMSQALRKLTPLVSRSNTVVIFINQLREKVGMAYGNPETTPGGRALKYYASVRLDIRKVETLKSGSENIGNHVKCRVVKNKVAPPFREAFFDIMFGKGISKYGEVVDLAVERDIINKSGAWFSYQSERLAQGRDNVKQLMEERPELFQEISEKVQAALMEESLHPEKKPKAARGAKKAASAPSRSSTELDAEVDDGE